MGKRKKITRREFVKGTVGAGVAAATAGCASVVRSIASDGGPAQIAREFDYIVVGSGAGGGPVACRLALEGYSVCLMEAGKDYKGPNYEVPAFHPMAVDDPGMRWDFFVKHYENPPGEDSKADPEGILYPRAGTLGGCTAHNAMVTLYPENKDWNDLADTLGDESFRAEEMRKYYDRLVRREGPFWNPAEQNQPKRGWLGVEKSPFLVRWQDALGWEMHRIAQGAVGAKTTLDIPALYKIKDPNEWDEVVAAKNGAFEIPKATWQGKRSGSKDFIKKTEKMREKEGNFFVSTETFVTRVVLDEKNHAIGVECLQGANLYGADPNTRKSYVNTTDVKFIRAKREVILAGGAFNTPQLLMLSGIGEGLRVDLPGVGRNLQDRYEIGVVSKLKEPFTVLRDCTWGAPGDPCLKQYRENPLRSSYSSNGPLVAMLSRSQQSKDVRDLCVFALPGYFRGYYQPSRPGQAVQRPNFWSKDCLNPNYMTWAILKGHTKNRAGTVKLRSMNPLDTPEINFHYFNEGDDPQGHDFAALMEGVKIARELNDTRLIRELIERPEVPPASMLNPKDPLALRELRQFVRRESWGHHASCTCKMGRDDDPMAVLDNKFRVRKTTGLRVVDASVFPRLPGLFIALPIYMMAEKASDAILADAKTSKKS